MSDFLSMFDYTGKTAKVLGKSKVNIYKDIYAHLSDKQNDKILGAHIIGHEAGTIIHEISVAMGFGASSEDVARICHGHPTVNEAIKEAALATYSKAIHS